jgi:hypothetical protein
MSFLAPGALIWLASLPVLLWLWRLASTRRQVLIPSLIPFEHLVRRAPKRRSRLVVSVLFWFQLAALLALTAALARPVLLRPRAATVLVVLDTSASMGARAPGLFGGGAAAFERARRALLSRLSRKAPTEQWLVVTTAPVASLTPQPTSDAAALRQAIEAARVSHLGGNLSTAAHIGRMLLAAGPDRTVVVTDEARPAEEAGERLEWVTVGAPAPNVALVGLDAQGPLCHAAEASVVATVQNFSGDQAAVTLVAAQDGRRLAEARADFAPGERRSLALVLPDEAAGWAEIRLDAARDGLEADNRAWVDIHRGAAVPIVVRPHAAAFKDTLSTWLGACETLTWTVEEESGPPAGHAGGGALVITDQADAAGDAAASMVFEPPEPARPMLSRWVTASGHPIGSYLAPVETVAAALTLSPWAGSSGTAVVAALVNGRKVPVVVAEERDGFRRVVMRVDPSFSRDATPVLLAFFNSLRWLMGQSAETLGGPLLAGGFAPGRVAVRRPDGSTDQTDASGGTVRYDAATVAGLYRFLQGAAEATVAVNFFDPLESNLLHRASTWRAATPPAPAAEAGAEGSRAGRAAHPLSRFLMLAILAVLLLEWWRYTRVQMRRPLPFFPSEVGRKKGSGPGTIAAQP